MFRDLSSSPPTMAACKVVDIFALMPGHDVQQADATQAYTQSKLGGTPYLDSVTQRQVAQSLGHRR
eukprot:6549069-Prorocentrum_lima.AAC.1